MDHGKVLKRAWGILWGYRALWVFGFILALTAGGGGGGGRGSNTWAQYSFEGIPPRIGGILVAIGISLACLVAILIIAAAIARYVAETALIQMVDGYEETGRKQTVGEGFRLGWSRSAFRLFLIDLVIGVPTTLIFILLLLLAAAPLLLWLTKSTVAGVLGTAMAIGLGLPVILLAIIVAVVLSVLKPFFRRVCVLEGLGVTESIRQGYTMVTQNLKDVGLMWLITLGLRIGWAIAMIPIAFLLFIVGTALGGSLAFVAGGLARLFFLKGAAPWITAAMVGIPIFILVIAVPLSFLSGLFETFISSTWTLTYRELHTEGTPV